MDWTKWVGCSLSPCLRVFFRQADPSLDRRLILHLELHRAGDRERILRLMLVAVGDEGARGSEPACSCRGSLPLTPLRACLTTFYAFGFGTPA